MDRAELATRLDAEFQSISLQQRLALIAEHTANAVFTTSLGMEDQVLTGAIADQDQPIRIVTLQTGRLFAETITLIEATRERYGIEIQEYAPADDAVEEYVKTYGLDGFYQSVEARKACCNIRKMVPLALALKGADGWITGLRREQSNNRVSVPFVEWDETRGLLKFNPLADWTLQDIRDAVDTNDIPISPLHARNYPSIGCEPCTRAIKPGEPERAGRWWWEQDNSRECGLHVPEPDGGIETTASHALAQHQGTSNV